MRKLITKLISIQPLILLALFTSGSTLEAQENRYPLLAMKLVLVPELSACAPYGYDRGGCRILKYEDVEPYLRRTESVAEAKPSPPSPPNQAISLTPSGLHRRLDNYRRRMKNSRLAPEERQSVVVIFDFGEPSSTRSTPLDLAIAWVQSGTGCSSQPLTERKGEPYLVTIPPNHRYVIYHQSADQFIPCSSVTWVVAATDRLNAKTYSPWAFQTTP